MLSPDFWDVDLGERGVRKFRLIMRYLKKLRSPHEIFNCSSFLVCSKYVVSFLVNKFSLGFFPFRMQFLFFPSSDASRSHIINKLKMKCHFSFFNGPPSLKSEAICLSVDRGNKNILARLVINNVLDFPSSAARCHVQCPAQCLLEVCTLSDLAS